MKAGGSADAEAGKASGPDGVGGEPGSGRLGELARLFAKLGVVAFGGPAAHIAMMEEEVVGRRGWMSRQRFLDLVGATNLIPGPNSTEMAIHVGYIHAGWRGLLVGGACFIGPAVLITGGFAWAYVRYGSLPAVEPWLRGIQPAVLAVIFGALWRLGRTAARGPRLALIGTAVAAAVLAGVNEVVALLAGGVVGTVWLGWRGKGGDAGAMAASGEHETEAAEVATGDPGADDVEADRARAADGAPDQARENPPDSASRGGWLALLPPAAGAAAASVSLWQLFLFFLKVGAVLYGSGYVLVAFLEGGLVTDLGWLTRQQLLDAIAIGQFTPGPVLSTSTFIGYVVAGTPGAAVATAGIFAPGFLFVLALNPVIPKLRESRWTAAFLDAVNAAAVGLMAAVTISLARGVLVGPVPWAIAVAAAVLHLRFGVGAAWLVLGGAAAGALLGA